MREYIDDFVKGSRVEPVSVVKYPFDPNGPYKSARVMLPHISGVAQQGSIITFVHRGYIIVNRSGKFDVQPDLYLRGPRFDFAGKELTDIILKPNRKVVLSGSILEGAQQFSISTDTTWRGVDSLKY